jgi:type I restriction enzyme S subunit
LGKGGKYPEVPFRRLFRSVERPIADGAEIVTAYTDGTVTLRRNRPIKGYHEAADLSGFKGVCVGDFVVHGLDILRGSVGVSDSDGAISSVFVTCVSRCKRLTRGSSRMR